MGKHKSASLTGVLLARKGEATAAGFAMSALESYRAMESARVPAPQLRPAPPAPPPAPPAPPRAPPAPPRAPPKPAVEDRAARPAPARDRRRDDVAPGAPGAPGTEDDLPTRPYPLLIEKKILIVEDNALDMKLFHDLLELHGCSTLRAREGREALALARGERPDLILMDMRLPGASGLEVTRWLKEDDDLRSIPVIAVTAYLMGGDGERFRKEGCEACIAKPISIAGFLRTCAEAMPAARSPVRPP